MGCLEHSWSADSLADHLNQITEAVCKLSGVSGHQGALWHRQRRAWYGSLQAECSVFTLQLSVFILIASDSVLPTCLRGEHLLHPICVTA